MTWTRGRTLLLVTMRHEGLPRKLRRHAHYHLDFRWRGRSRRFHNAHSGERCFILGNGPSLNSVDLSRLAKEYTFGTNGIYLKHMEIGFAPTYYVVEDRLFLSQRAKEINEVNYSIRFFPIREAGVARSLGATTFFLDFDWSCYSPSSAHHRDPRFSTDITRVVGTGGSVTFVALQIAFYMGFDPIYLVGMDHDVVLSRNATQVGTRRYRTEGEDLNHFDPRYGDGTTWSSPDWDLVDRAFRQAREVFEQSGRRVLNATAGGKLEVFERVEIESLEL